MGTLLELVRDDRVTRVIPVGDRPISVGTDLGNVLVLDDDAVSAFHLVLTPGADGLIAVDLGSTNGTAVNGTALQGPTALQPGDLVQLRPNLALRVCGRRAPAKFALRERDTGIGHALEPPGLSIGSAPGAGIHIEGAPATAGWVLLTEGEVWLSTEDDERELFDGDAFEVAGVAFELLARPSERRTTLYERLVPEPYRLSSRLDGPSGPEARILDPANGREHLVTAANRAILLHVLAERRAADLADDTPETLAGWMDDEDIAVALWGRAAWTQSASRYSVLIHRTRKELREAGFDPWFLEKRRGATRVVIAIEEEV